jgi:hypothetical protein
MREKALIYEIQFLPHRFLILIKIFNKTYIPNNPGVVRRAHM